MNKNIITALLLTLFLSLSASAQNFLFIPNTGAEFIELPPQGGYPEFVHLIDVDLPLGRMELNDVADLPHPIEVRLKISRSKDWHLRFYIDDEMIGYLYFTVRNGQGQFKGMLINDQLRNKGLSKFFLKYYVLFCRHFGLEPQTAIIYKPLMARVLMRFGYFPKKQRCRVIIRNGGGPITQVFPVGFELRGRLVDSQHLLVLPTAPPEAEATHVFIHTRFVPPTDPGAIETFWLRIAAIRGRFYLYRNDQALMMNAPLFPPATAAATPLFPGTNSY